MECWSIGSQWAIRITPLLQHSIAEIAGVAELADALDSKSSVSPSTPMTALAHQRPLANKNDHFRRS